MTTDKEAAEEPKILRPARPRAGRRQRVRRITLVLACVALAAVAAGLVSYHQTRTPVRRPGEALLEITEKLSRQLPEDAPAPRFTDVTSEAGLDGFVAFTGSRTSQLPEDMGAGLAWGDFDNDGDDDLFLVSAGGALTLAPEERAPSQLYQNSGGVFHRVADFPEIRILGMGAAWGDVDGDGWLDLAVSGYDTLLLLRNRQGRLVRDASFPTPPGYWAGLAWGDFDNDRDLDLYVCGYVRYVPTTESRRRTTEQYGAAVPYTLNPASFEPERNLLLQNQGPAEDGGVRFTEVASLYGVSNPEGRSLSALWHDFDDDGWLDLYVANDISDNALYLNRRETFEDAGLQAFVADYRGAMGLAVGDWNRDGDDDLFITHWIAQENALYDSRLRELKEAGPAGASAPGGAPRLTFSDMAVPLGLGQIALQLIGWGTAFADFDGDGWLDLVVANGSTFEDEAHPPVLEPQPPLLLWNQRGEYFHDLAPLVEPFREPRVSRGLALADYDSDGDLDVAMVHLDGGVQLVRNDMQHGHWLEVSLRSRTAEGEPKGFGDGATVIATVGGAPLRRSVTGGSYLSQSSRLLHFGLGAAERVDSLEVRWPAGESQTFAGLEAGAAWELFEGDPVPRRLGVAKLDERQRRTEFWSTQRAAMDALKREGDVERAAELFRRALALDPGHQDSRYYLANCLAIQGRDGEALAELERLRSANPSSHRAHKQWGVLRSLTATSAADLEAATLALERAVEINPEETGALLMLGEIALLSGQLRLADQRFDLACRTNPKAVGGLFLRGYLAWKDGRDATAADFLAAAREARGAEWKPEGAVAEGDVASRMHREETPLGRFWEGWDGSSSPAAAFGPLDAHLEKTRFPS